MRLRMVTDKAQDAHHQRQKRRDDLHDRVQVGMALPVRFPKEKEGHQQTDSR